VAEQKYDPSKLTSINEFGEKVHIIPAEVRGFFRRWRNIVQAILLFIFLLLPWTKMGGIQTILLDIPKREFTLFGTVFYATDTPLLVLIAFILVFGLAFITSVWGRIWCGWACPQTVFIDLVFRRIEILVEGDYIKRRRMRDGPPSFEKFWRGSLKWTLFFLVSSIIAHSFAAYFVGAEALIQMIQTSPAENMTTFWVILFFTAVTLFDFAWFREQFCVIMCPYGRIQSLLIDKSSLTVAYDVGRGEPRRGMVPPGQTQGDCVACNRCVQVCPTGIDIRNGLQMECIACTACIDACDEIMTKVKKPTGLIRYKTLEGDHVKFWKPRTLVYLVVILGCFAALTTRLALRSNTDFSLLRAVETPFTELTEPDGQKLVMNHFRLHVHNQSSLDREYVLEIPENIRGEISITTASNPQKIKAGELFTWHFFVKIKTTAFDGKTRINRQIRFYEKPLEGQDKISFDRTLDLSLIGPSLPQTK
jgi:cytochrome c oxidase accessory protein FixG